MNFPIQIWQRSQGSRAGVGDRVLPSRGPEPRPVVVVVLLRLRYPAVRAPGYAAAAYVGLAVTGCGKLYRARSRLYRNENLQVNMRLKALAEIYTMHSLALLYNHIFSKNLLEFLPNFL